MDAARKNARVRGDGIRKSASRPDSAATHMTMSYRKTPPSEDVCDEQLACRVESPRSRCRDSCHDWRKRGADYDGISRNYCVVCPVLTRYLAKLHVMLQKEYARRSNDA
jgi:hypothetical protein